MQDVLVPIASKDEANLTKNGLNYVLLYLPTFQTWKTNSFPSNSYSMKLFGMRYKYIQSGPPKVSFFK